MTLARALILAGLIAAARAGAAEISTADTQAAISPATQRLSVAEAVMIGLENNRGLRVERFNVDIRRTFEQGSAPRSCPWPPPASPAPRPIPLSSQAAGW